MLASAKTINQMLKTKAILIHRHFISADRHNAFYIVYILTISQRWPHPQQPHL